MAQCLSRSSQSTYVVCLRHIPDRWTLIAALMIYAFSPNNVLMRFRIKFYKKILQRSPEDMKQMFDEIDLDGSGELSLVRASVGLCWHLIAFNSTTCALCCRHNYTCQRQCHYHPHATANNSRFAFTHTHTKHTHNNTRPHATPTLHRTRDTFRRSS